MAITAMSNPDQKRAPAAGGWIPWVFVGLFLLVLAVNGAMIVIAVSTFTGLETTNAYEKGLAYNQRLDAAAAQGSLGWQTELSVTPLGDKRVSLGLQLTDRLGNPITSAEVVAALVRPVQEGFDQTLRFEDQGEGRYGADIDLPLPGQWDITITVNARDKAYQLTERLHIKP